MARMARMDLVTAFVSDVERGVSRRVRQVREWGSAGDVRSVATVGFGVFEKKNLLTCKGVQKREINGLER